MTTTETAQTLPGTVPPNEPEPEAETETATPAPEGKSNTREYTLFEEARTDTWTKLGTVTSDTTENAIDTLGEQKLKSGQRFMAIPTRFVVPKKPKVTTVTTVTYD